MALGPPLKEFVNVSLSLAGASADKFSFGSLIGVFNHSATANRTDGPFSTPEALNAAGFDSASEPEVNAWGNAALAQENGIDEILVGREDVGDTDWTDTLDQVEADIGSEAFYLVNIESRLQADIELAAAWAESRGDVAPKLYIAQSSDAAILAGTAANVALNLQAANYVRTGLIYHRFDDSAAGAAPPDGYLDGAWTGRCGGFNLDAPAGAGNWIYKPLSSVTFDPLTEPQITEVWDANANLLGSTKGLNFPSKGTLASGRFIDITTSLDWGRVRIGEAVLEEFVGEPVKIPFTSAGLNRLRAVAQGVLEQGVTFGHFSPDFPRTVTPPRIEEVSDSDKTARVVTMTGNVVLAGAIQAVTYEITVQQ